MKADSCGLRPGSRGQGRHAASQWPWQRGQGSLSNHRRSWARKGAIATAPEQPHQLALGGAVVSVCNHASRAQEREGQVTTEEACRPGKNCAEDQRGHARKNGAGDLEANTPFDIRCCRFP